MGEFIDDIKDEHKTIRLYLFKLQSLESSGDWRQRELEYAKLKDVLFPHLHAEETVLFPLMANREELREKILYYIHQHSIIKKFNDELSDRSKRAYNWLAGIKTFHELIEMHIKREEPEYCRMIGFVDPERLESVHKRFLQEEIRWRKQMQDLKTKPY
ncbi:Hemerythrin HHE cation binding domain protein [Chitinispirillum alkaliphilum]|nr:Hemerythrin HHE cation binding domain protein [Chitinispirillum alkaliphilum]